MTGVAGTCLALHSTPFHGRSRPMLNFLTQSFLHRRLARRIPNPLLRTALIVGGGYAARQLIARRAARKRMPGRSPSQPAGPAVPLPSR